MMTAPHIEPIPAALGDAVRLFNEREFFACHDVLEELWGATLGEDRDFFQGVLHVAVSLFHLSEGNPAGARKRHVSSLKSLAGDGDQFYGIDRRQLRTELHCHFESLRRGIPLGMATPDIETLPRLDGTTKHE